MKKILFILPKFEFGGTVFSTLNMIRMLEKVGKYQICVYPMISDGPVRHVYEGVNILNSDFLLESSLANLGEYTGIKNLKMIFGKLVRKSSGKNTHEYNQSLYVKLAKQLQSKHRFDFVVSCQEGDSTEFASYFKNCKRIAWFRSEMSVYLKRHISRERAAGLATIYNRMDSIICVSKTTRNDFARYFPDINDRILAIHNIQDTAEIIRKSEEPIEDQMDPAFFNIISVGRMSPQKRFASIPQIAHQIVDNGLTNFRWYIVGDGNKGGEYDLLLHNLDQYGMREYVKLMGSRVNPYPYIKSADILAIPSSYEACPRVVAEAHILHTPVISADYSSASEFVLNGYDGFVGSIDVQSELISKMIKGTEDAKTIVENCNNFKFDTDHILDQLLAVFS